MRSRIVEKIIQQRRRVDKRIDAFEVADMAMVAFATLINVAQNADAGDDIGASAYL